MEDETRASIVIGPDLEEGNYRLVLVAVKGNIIISEELTFTVVEIPPAVTFYSDDGVQ